MKKREKKGRSATSVIASDKVYIKSLIRRPDREQVYASFVFLDHLRNEPKVVRDNKIEKLLKDTSIRDILFFNMGKRDRLIALDFHLIPRSAEEELDWASKVICSYKDEINSFIRLRSSFDKCYLLGEYSEALKVVDKSREEIGLNIWLVQAELLLLKSFENSKKINNYINSNPVDNENSEYYISTEVTKIDPNISASRYKFSFESNIEEMRGHGANSLAEVASFIHMYSPDLEIESPEKYISKFQMMNIYDYYYYCMRLLKHLVVKGENVKASFLINKIIDVIDDPDLRFLSYKSGSKKLINISDENLLYIDACKNYEKGEYSECLEKLNLLIYRDPVNLVPLELALKSSLMINFEVSFPGVIGEIFSYLQKFALGKYEQVDIDRFEKICLSHSYSDWSYLLTAILLRYSEGEDETNLRVFYEFSENLTTLINPYSKDFGNIELCDFLNEIGVDWVNYWRDVKANKINSGNDLASYCELGVNEDRLVKIMADSNYQNENYDNALFYYDNGLGGVIFKEYFLFRKIRILCYLSRYEEVLEIAANKLISGESAFRVPLEFIIERCAPFLKSFKSESVLNLAIIYHHENQRNGKYQQKLSICCYHYFKLKEIRKGSGFDKLMVSDKSRYFMREILTEDILDGFPRFFSSQKEILNYRISSLRNLLIKSEGNPYEKIRVISKLATFSKIYLKESVKEEIGRGRIFIGKENLLAIISNKIREDYSSLKSEIPSDFVLGDESFENVIGKDDSSYVLDDSLKQLQLLFLTVRDDYAVHKLYGLDHYLNLNIRHGGMVNHLWKPLRKHELACEYDSEGKYKPIEKWEKHYNLKRNDIIKLLHSHLKKFTSSMNDVINEAKGWVHVNMGEFSNDKKIFNFTFYIESLEVALNNFKSSDNVEAFVHSTFNQLDEMLDESLEIAKEKMLVDLKNKVMKSYDDLIGNIKDIGFDNESYIYRIISTSRSEYNAAIEELSEWFSYKESGNQSLPLELLIETVHDNISNYYPAINSCLDVRYDNADVLIKAKYITYFYDVFNLLLNNAFQHSGQTNVLNIVVEISSIEERIDFSFVNNVSIYCFNELEKTIDHINNVRIPDYEKFASKDHGSGICKVKKILMRDIGIESDLSVECGEHFFKVIFAIDSLVISEDI